MRAVLRTLATMLAVTLAVALAGCGADYKLPTQNIPKPIPTDKSYQMLSTWTGMDYVQDILLTQQGSQLFILFNFDPNGTGTAPRGEVKAYPLSRSTPIPGITFPTLFNPVALCAGGGSLFVLDQGDTCIARTNPITGRCDTTGNYLLPRERMWTNSVVDIEHYWRVRQYGLLGGDTVSTFTDTTMAFVDGVAADGQGRVYVSGTAIILEPDADNPRLRTRKFVSVIYRYLAGALSGDDVPGTYPWHRDLTWSVDQGTGFGNVVEPRGIHWGAYGGGGVYCAVYGRNYAQRFSDAASNGGDPPAMSSAEDLPLEKPVDVYSDLQGFTYVVDQGNQRVLRFDPDKQYVQRVDLEPDALGRHVLLPVAVAADDSLAYVADRGLGTVLRFKRRR